MKKSALRFSLISRNSKFQFEVAVVLTSIIPFLVFFHVGSANGWWEETSLYSMFLIALGCVVPVLLGYVVIGFYPATIMRIRRYLEEIAREELPEKIDLIRREDDFTAIQNAMNMVLEKQRRMMVLERQRVMVESFGAACHHLGQPMTVISTCLEMMRRTEKDGKKLEIIGECIRASSNVSDILDKFRGQVEYRTVPYCVSSDNGSGGRIVDV